jgi:UDP-2-acetamido-3-amino-2,3-dideoxy-glucuronate N-acetyltransferase
VDASRPAPRVAVVGAGTWGRHVARNLEDLGALAAVCDTSPARLAEWRGRDGHLALCATHRAVLRDPGIDAVAIATPAETHADLVEDALRAGKDVLVEKPLCLAVARGERLVQLARERGRILMVGHLLRYHGAVLRLQELVAAGALGRLRYLYSSRLNLGRIRREENILWSFAPHDLSVILGLIGEMPDRVQAQGGNYLHQQVADVTVTLLAFPSGVKAHVFVSWLHPFKEQKLVVVGERKMAVFDDVEPHDKLLLYPHSIDWKAQVPVTSRAEAEVVAFDPVEPLRAECRHFLDCLRTRTPPRTDGEEGLRVLRVLERCQHALDTSPGEGRSHPPESPSRWFAHPSAVIDDGVTIGDGTTIWHVSHLLRGSRVGRDCRIGQNVVIGPNVTVGDGVKIQNNVSVYEGVTLEDHVFCGPSMVFTNVVNPRSEIPRRDELRPTLVRRGATLGANSTILCGTTIGSYAFVGAGAVVTRDVPAHALVTGNPARIRAWMCRCGTKLIGTARRPECPACGRRYRRRGERVEPAAAAAGDRDRRRPRPGGAPGSERAGRRRRSSRPRSSG